MSYNLGVHNLKFYTKFNKISLFIILLILSCNTKKDSKVSKVLKLMYGKEVFFNSDLKAKKLGKAIETSKLSFHDDYNKIVVYIDSSGCTPCRMKLEKWKIFVKKIEEQNLKVEFIFIYSTHNEVKLDREFIFAKFDRIVYYDSNFNFAKSNKLPEDSKYHTFLIDSNNKIILVGDPLINKNFEDLYYEKLMQN